MALDCPRCPASQLTERHVTPTGGGAQVDVFRCEGSTMGALPPDPRAQGCQGVWLDGQTLASICPTLSHLPQHRDEIALVGREGAGIERCLRCGVPPFEYRVIGVAIDFCLRCHGVWLDGDEYEEPAGDEPAPVAVRGGPYRRSASALAGDVKCAYCGESVDPRRAYVRERGPACTRCHYTVEQRIADRRATEGWTDLPAPAVRAGGLLEALVMSVRSLLDWQR